MLLFFKSVQLRNLLMKQRQTHAGLLQINYEILITYSLRIHVLFDVTVGGVSMFYGKLESFRPSVD